MPPWDMAWSPGQSQGQLCQPWPAWESPHNSIFKPPSWKCKCSRPLLWPTKMSWHVQEAAQLSCLLRGLHLLLTKKKNMELAPSSRHIMCPTLAKMNVKLWAIKKIQNTFLPGPVCAQCFSRRKFPAQGSVPEVQLLPACSQALEGKHQLTWGLSAAGTQLLVLLGSKEKVSVAEGRRRFWGEKLREHNPSCSPRTSSASQGITLNSTDKAGLFPLELYDFILQ